MYFKQKKESKAIDWCFCFALFYFFYFFGPHGWQFIVNFGWYTHAEQDAYFHPFKIWSLCFIQKARKISDCFLLNGPLLL